MLLLSIALATCAAEMEEKELRSLAPKKITKEVG